MIEKTQESVVIEAPLSKCVDVVLDLSKYPQWLSDIKNVEILEKDDKGNATKAKFRAAAFGRSMNYTLNYDNSNLPNSLSWTQAEADLTTKLDGEYVFDKIDDKRTQVIYKLEVEMKIPLPGFIKRRTEARIIQSAIKELKRRVESLK
jgi:ribosome-associated toxin RatA of RatAB toxin-antitoxin module